jgi:hypothetical protein
MRRGFQGLHQADPSAAGVIPDGLFSGPNRQSPVSLSLPAWIPADYESEARCSQSSGSAGGLESLRK